jgi:alpha-mannosidase
MSRFMHYTKHSLDRVCREIYDAVYKRIGALDITAWRTAEPVPFAMRESGEKLNLSVGDKWGELFDCAWFNFTGAIPAEASQQAVVLLIDVNGELCVVDQNGAPILGLTNKATTFDPSLGRGGKYVFPISPCAGGGERIDVWADAGCNDLFGSLSNNGTIRDAFIAICHPEVKALYHDFEVLLDFLKVLPENSPRYRQIHTALYDAGKVLQSAALPASAAAARQKLAPMLEKQGGDPSLRISAIGHAHMDLGWLWPIRETLRKGARTFATALANIDKYPDYVFGASQPQLYQWMKETYPALYARIKGAVKNGRIEAQGAMWVEADTNVTGGESLVRQLLYGKRFFRKEFGVDCHYLWLPDVFGYTAALPQILRKAEVEYFMTQKLSWNQINVFPHHSFHWQGLDGTSVLAHMLPEDTYNSPAAPHAVSKIEKNYKEAGVSGYSLMLFGIGDGGGGPGEEHLERLARVRNLAGLSPVKQEPASAFFEKWAKESDRFPRWVGELYLERHQGTFTTEAKNKWYNRRMEQALRELEWLAAIARYISDEPYPSTRLELIWKEVLLYQFHDILPGSSIKRVYDESLARYELLLEEVENSIRHYQGHLAKELAVDGRAKPYAVFNSLSWERCEWIQLQGQWQWAVIPALGCKAMDAAQASTHEEEAAALTARADSLENDYLRVNFHSDGSIASIYDKKNSREVLLEGRCANRFAVYRDLGDAWDSPLDYAEQTPRYLQLTGAKASIDGPRALLEQVYKLGDSELVQEIILTLGSPRLNFVTRVRWREVSSMLRTSFPVAVQTSEAACEIQFGFIRRPTHQNTTWDLAKDEVPAHKWVDLSQRDYGVALLNDSKYGHKVKHNVIDLNLLRSVPYPHPPTREPKDTSPGAPHFGYTDQSDHSFSYALYPHAGDHIAGGVIRAGYEFNYPLRTLALQARQSAGPASKSFLQIDVSNIIIETVKKAEDDEGLIIRLYEATGASTPAVLQFGVPVDKVEETNLLEEKPQLLELAQNSIHLVFLPFEIKTIKATR